MISFDKVFVLDFFKFFGPNVNVIFRKQKKIFGVLEKKYKPIQEFPPI